MPRPTGLISDEIVNKIRKLIEQRGLEPGMRLPAERLLATTFGCSRSIVREALKKLIGAGIVTSKQGGGTYLCYTRAEYAPQHLDALKTLIVEDPSYYLDILEARHSIEASTAWYAALRATDEDKAKLHICYQATVTFQNHDAAELAAQADVRFHLAIAEASHNVVLLQTMRNFFDLLQTSVLHSRQQMYRDPEIFSRLSEQHRELLDAIVAGDAELAKQCAQNHLGFVHDTLRKFQEDWARKARIGRLPTNDNP